MAEFSETSMGRIFQGSQKAYLDSLPARHWVRTGSGWASHSRAYCDPETSCCPPQPAFVPEVVSE